MEIIDVYEVRIKDWVLNEPMPLSITRNSDIKTEIGLITYKIEEPDCVILSISTFITDTNTFTKESYLKCEISQLVKIEIDSNLPSKDFLLGASWVGMWNCVKAFNEKSLGTYATGISLRMPTLKEMTAQVEGAIDHWVQF